MHTRRALVLLARAAPVAAQPALLNAAWDWGGGDFETALAGAAHRGTGKSPNP